MKTAQTKKHIPLSSKLFAALPALYLFLTICITPVIMCGDKQSPQQPTSRLRSLFKTTYNVARFCKDHPLVATGFVVAVATPLVAGRYTETAPQEPAAVKPGTSADASAQVPTLNTATTHPAGVPTVIHHHHYSASRGSGVGALAAGTLTGLLTNPSIISSLTSAVIGASTLAIAAQTHANTREILGRLDTAQETLETTRRELSQARDALSGQIARTETHLSHEINLASTTIRQEITNAVTAESATIRTRIDASKEELRETLEESHVHLAYGQTVQALKQEQLKKQINFFQTMNMKAMRDLRRDMNGKFAEQSGQLNALSTSVTNASSGVTRLEGQVATVQQGVDQLLQGQKAIQKTQQAQNTYVQQNPWQPAQSPATVTPKYPCTMVGSALLDHSSYARLQMKAN